MSSMKVRIKKLRDDAKVPMRGTDDAAGADLYACFDDGEIEIDPGCTVMIPTGVAVEIPSGCAGLVMARSGLAAKRDLAPANKVGLVDSDYRGEVMVALHNHGLKTQVVEKYERIAQLMIVPYIMADYVEADELSDSARGAGGFGSTGSK